MMYSPVRRSVWETLTYVAREGQRRWYCSWTARQLVNRKLCTAICACTVCMELERLRHVLYSTVHYIVLYSILLYLIVCTAQYCMYITCGSSMYTLKHPRSAGISRSEIMTWFPGVCRELWPKEVCCSLTHGRCFLNVSE